MFKNTGKLLFLVGLSLILLVMITAPLARAEKKKTEIHKASPAQLKLIKNVDLRYQKHHGIAITLKKKLINELLGKETISEGSAWFNKGMMRLEFKKPKQLLMVADKDYFWIEEHPPTGSEGGRVNVVKATLDSDRARSQGLMQILTGGKILKYFKVTGVKKDDKDSFEFFLQPERTSAEFKRAMITISKSKKLITELRYWDALDNETHYTFETTKFNQTIDKKMFDYQIPKGADVTTF